MTTIRFQMDFGSRTPTPRRIPAQRVGAGSEGSCPEPLPYGVARLLVIAHHVERLVGEGTFPDSASAGAALGLRQPRVQQILRLLVLAPDIQERILRGEVSWSEKRVQPVLNELDWDEQRTILSGTGS